MNETNNPTVYVVMHNIVILGAYSRPEWAASKVASVLNEELASRTRVRWSTSTRCPMACTCCAQGTTRQTSSTLCTTRRWSRSRTQLNTEPTSWA